MPLQRTQHPSQHRRPGTRVDWFGRMLVVALCVAVGWFYAWTVRSNGEEWNFGEEQRDYYNLLIDGYLDGQLHMKVAVPDALLGLSDPYDPQQRPPGLGLHDASFYKGRYYVYFGIAPMVALMLPFRVLTGVDLPLAVAVLVFVSAGFVVSVGLWLAIRRRYFPETGALPSCLGVLVLGLAGVGAVLLRRPDMWELPIAGGYFFAMLALACLWWSVQSERKRTLAFAGAGLALGLAIASRPTYLFAVPLLLPPLVWWWRSERRLPLRPAVGAAAALAIVGGLMAWHNQARFGNPLEFGQAYQFSLDYESKQPHFRAAYVPFTTKAHFFSTARWSGSFPFIVRGDLGAAPDGFTAHRGDVFGLLTNFPIAWLAFLSPLALWRRPLAERGPFAAWLGSATLLFLLTAAVLLFFFSALARYQMDFAPAFMLLASVGLLGLERWLQNAFSTPARIVARTLCIVATIVSAGFGVLFSLAFDGVLRENNPRLERALARRFDGVGSVVERITGVRYGPLELTLRLPYNPSPGREVLISSGASPSVDRVFVQYREDGSAQFGFAAAGGGEQLSRPLSLDRNVPQRLVVSMSSLYPSPEHSFFGQNSSAEVRRTTRQLRIDVNGEPVLLDRYRGLRSHGQVAVGKDAAEGNGRPFSGTILSLRRDERAVVPETTGAFVRMRLTFGAGAESGFEPLIAWDDAEAAAVLAVTHVAPRQVKFGFLREGQPPLESEIVAIEPRDVHELRVRFEATPELLRPRMLLWCDAGLAWAPELVGTEKPPRPIQWGRNESLISGCAREFSGSIVSVEHEPNGRDPLERSGNVRLDVKLPAGRTGTREPLLVTGRTGAADMLMIEYVDARSVRFGLDHWGAPMRWSETLSLDFDRSHTLEIAMPSLGTVDDADSAGDSPGELMLAMDGRQVWRQSANFFPSETGEMWVGRNPLGGTSCGPEFTGSVFSAVRKPRE